MQKILIIHGIEGSPNENWIPWLKAELEKFGHDVIVPQFPNPNYPNLDEWMKVFEGLKMPNDFVLVGHSLGGAFILSILEKHKAKAAFIVAGVPGPLDNIYDSRMTTFSHKEFDFEAINANCKRIYAYHSEDDPYIPIEDVWKLAEKLGITVTIVPNAKHFNSTSGYNKFELLLSDIMKIIS